MGERALYRYIPPIFPQSGLADWTAGAGPYRFPGVSPNCVFCLIVGRAARQVEFGLPGSCSSKEGLPLSLPGGVPIQPGLALQTGAKRGLYGSSRVSGLLRLALQKAHQNGGNLSAGGLALRVQTISILSGNQLLRIGPLHSPGCPSGGIRTVGKIL